MPIRSVSEPVAEATLARIAQELLAKSTLCAIATVADDDSAYVNTAYFAFTRRLEIVWLSAPSANHSRNIRSRPGAAAAVYDSAQCWGGADRGLQLFGTAEELPADVAGDVLADYAARFPASRGRDMAGLRVYRLLPVRIKLFDETSLGGGTFVMAAVDAGGRLTWLSTEVYG